MMRCAAGSAAGALAAFIFLGMAAASATNPDALWAMLDHDRASVGAR
ncbi:hypothetical protein HJG45_25075 [Roseicella sp. DB1501]|nr:hypothetical protein [Roseicella sp. DB1501]